ncbi:hypothetical protein B0F90DRAFT_1180665 [Multifurca ochricompacta]|uniref:Uncharacterized protein n=1 Tax=Multifurca ochricompacta TaxID=376703 RepID=A0AAD4MA25_9AGAM|nr:hypothetical protein B0F90DRAFT_1180665 [Multifurca ochricompacta]
MHISQIDPRLFNPTSSELAGALTLPPLDSSNNLQDAYVPTTSQADLISTSPTGRSTAESRYCSVKGCRNVIGGEYLFKMCVPCRNRYRGYGMTKRSKWKRGREIAAQELDRVRAEEDARRVQQGLPLIGELQTADRRAWERRVLEAIPRSPVVQYAPISMLPVRMCTVSHCHTVLQGHYPYRRCERHRLQNRHHSKLKRVRDKEVKSTPLRSESARDADSAENKSRKGKAKATEPLYTNEPLDFDARELETEGGSASEHEEMPDESSIPPPARGARRSNTVCSVKWCHNVLDYRSPWKMCETHREKDRMNRKRKSDRDKGINDDLDEAVAAQVNEHAMAPAGLESNTDPVAPVLQNPTPAPDPQIIFMEPLLPPAETVLHQTEMSEYPGIPPQDAPLLSYESTLPEAGVITEVPADPGVASEVDIEKPSRQSITEEPLAEEPCIESQATPTHSQQDIPSMVWRSAASPASTSGSDSSPSDYAPSSSACSNATAGRNTPSSPTTSTILTSPVPPPFSTASSSVSHIQPQFQVPYYVPPPFSLPYTPGQPPFLVPSPYPPMSYPPRPPFTYGAPAPGPFQTYQFAPPPPGQLASYGLRPYPYPPWVPYASGPVEVNWFDVSAQVQVQMQAQTQGKVQRSKRGRAATDQTVGCKDGLRIVMVQPKSSNDDGAAAFVASAVTSTSTSASGPARAASEPSVSPPSSSVVNSPCAEALSTSGPVIPTNSAETTTKRLCSSEICHRQLPVGAPGTLCERCKARLKRRQEKTRLRLKLEPRRTRSHSLRLEV